jgi:hypothetical protein
MSSERHRPTVRAVNQPATATAEARARNSAVRLLATPIIRLALAEDTTPLPIILVAAGLCLGVGLVHLQDQGGFLGSESPIGIAIGYYAVEIIGAITIGFLLRQKVFGWLLGTAISFGPFVAYILSRTTGIPGDSGDIGNWGYTLGTVSLVIEGTLLVLSVAGLRRAWKALKTANASRATLLEESSASDGQVLDLDGVETPAVYNH